MARLSDERLGALIDAVREGLRLATKRLRKGVGVGYSVQRVADDDNGPSVAVTVTLDGVELGWPGPVTVTVEAPKETVRRLLRQAGE